MGTEDDRPAWLLSPLEEHIVELVSELSAAIADLVADDDDDSLPLAEFDQRLLLEHAQVISRYVLAQAAARAFPDRYRLIGRSVPSRTNGHEAPRVEVPHVAGNHQHHVADAMTARAAHESGRAIIGEHPWAHDHDHDHDHEHGDGHAHADEWEWEPIDRESPES